LADRYGCWALLACALLAGCAHPRTRQRPRPIDDLRERAAEHPNDKQAWLELALAEHLFDGADPVRARQALERAKQLGVTSLRLTFIEAEEHVLEARPGRALDAYFALLAAAPDSSDPLAPWLAESAFAALSDMNDAVDDYRARLREAARSLEAKRARLALTSAHQLAMQQLGQALLDGDLARAKSAAQLAGCVQNAQVAGPFGPRELLGFDRDLEAQKPGPLGKEYDLGPGRGVQPVRSIETRRCVLPLGRGAHDVLPAHRVTQQLRGLGGRTRAGARRSAHATPVRRALRPAHARSGQARAQAQDQLAPPQPGALARAGPRGSRGGRAHAPARAQ
jgi:hypothetical protein